MSKILLVSRLPENQNHNFRKTEVLTSEKPMLIRLKVFYLPKKKY